MAPQSLAVVLAIASATHALGTSQSQDNGVAGFQCTPISFANQTCYHNPDGKIEMLSNVASAEACCSACSNNEKCVAFTWYNAVDCVLFHTIAGQVDGECVSGNGGASPIPPPAPGPNNWHPPAPGPACKNCPNIIFSLTDDQDVALGGWDPMTKTKKLLQHDANGAFLENWRIHTPICSPSRSEAVSGRYFHNIKSDLNVPPAKLQPAASGHINGTLYSNATFGVYLRAAKGYQVGMFGKSNFNTYDGFDRWFQAASCGYGANWEDDESPTFHTHTTGYSTDVILNKSIEWIKRDNVSGATSGGRPWFVYFAPHCPHTPANPSTLYENACPNVTSPRIPNYNWTNDGFHQLVAAQPPLTAADELLIDDLARRRCQTLLSVDDAHAALVAAVKDIGAWDNTYWVISSDHGYNLGHHRIPSNKFLLYDHATRIPLVVRGPGIKGGLNPVLGTNVDYAPTWLAMAGIATPDTMDGRSILTQLVPQENEDELPEPTRNQIRMDRASLLTKPWRTEQFHQYYNQGGPSPWEPGTCPQTPGKFMPCEGWAPGSSTNPTQDAGGLQFPLFPRDDGVKATIRPLDDYSNTYIALHSMDPSIGTGHYKYGEYQYVCTPDEIAAKNCFGKIDHYELFDLTSDPYELYNVYNSTSSEIRDALAKKLRMYYPCVGPSCP